MYAIEKSILLVAGVMTYVVGFVLTGINSYRARSRAPLVARLEVASRILK